MKMKKKKRLSSFHPSEAKMNACPNIPLKFLCWLLKKKKGQTDAIFSVARTQKKKAGKGEPFVTDTEIHFILTMPIKLLTLLRFNEHSINKFLSIITNFLKLIIYFYSIKLFNLKREQINRGA